MPWFIPSAWNLFLLIHISSPSLHSHKSKSHIFKLDIKFSIFGKSLGGGGGCGGLGWTVGLRSPYVLWGMLFRCIYLQKTNTDWPYVYQAETLIGSVRWLKNFLGVWDVSTCTCMTDSPPFSMFFLLFLPGRCLSNRGFELCCLLLGLVQSRVWAWLAEILEVTAVKAQSTERHSSGLLSRWKGFLCQQQPVQPAVTVNSAPMSALILKRRGVISGHSDDSFLSMLTHVNIPLFFSDLWVCLRCHMRS